MERFRCVSVPFSSPFPLQAYFVWLLKEAYVFSGSQESLQNLERWEVGGQSRHQEGVAGLMPRSQLLGGAHLQSRLCVQQGPGAQLHGGWLSCLRKALPTVSRAGKKRLFSDVEVGLGEPASTETIWWWSDSMVSALG